VDTEENKCEIMDDYLDEFINSDDEYQQQIMESYEKEAQEQLQHQQQEEAIKLIQQAIKIKLEPNTASTSNNDDEDSIATITID
jgi:hypothetical protein